MGLDGLWYITSLDQISNLEYSEITTLVSPESCHNVIRICFAIGGDVDSPQKISKSLERLHLNLLSIEAWSSGLEEIELYYFWKGVKKVKEIEAMIDGIKTIGITLYDFQVPDYSSQMKVLEKKGLTTSWKHRKWDWIKFWAIHSSYMPSFGLFIDTDVIIPNNISSLWRSVCDTFENHTSAFILADSEPGPSSFKHPINSGVVAIRKDRLHGAYNVEVDGPAVFSKLSETQFRNQWPPEQWFWNCIIEKIDPEGFKDLPLGFHCNCANFPFKFLGSSRRPNIRQYCRGVWHYCNEKKSVLSVNASDVFSHLVAIQLESEKGDDEKVKFFLHRAANYSLY